MWHTCQEAFLFLRSNLPVLPVRTPTEIVLQDSLKKESESVSEEIDVGLAGGN